MSSNVLLGDDLLSELISEMGDRSKWSASTQEWVTALAQTITLVRNADKAGRSSREFQQMLWEKNRVAAVGQGNISVASALDDDTFREWLAQISFAPLPALSTERIAFLTNLYEDLKSQLHAFLPDRTPHLKIFRVLAALYPEAMTTVADRGKLIKLSRFLKADRGLRDAGLHVWIRDRIDSVLGPVENEPIAIAARMVLPWLIYEKYCRKDQGEQVEEPVLQDVKVHLRPLPVVQRLRSLAVIPDSFSGILAVLESVGDGATPDELLDFLRGLLPESKQASLKTIISALQSQFNVIERDGDRYIRTERGENLLASRDPSVLGDWLLTRVLGLDLVVAAIRDQGPLSTAEVIAILRRANPGLKTNFVPGIILGWLRSLKVVEHDSSKRFLLTEIGRQWAEWIDWAPEGLHAGPTLDDLFEEPTAEAVATTTLELPSLARIVEAVQKAGHLPAPLIARLHAGLWAHSRRHLAILTGLSGSGKTLLAREYARAITADCDGQHLLTIPVQPGWYDPGALLGYMNPIRGDSYIRTPVLEFLLAAAGDLSRPYVLVLDEMNLSHPEQYMAPLLSTMETGDAILLHTEDDIFDGVPPSIRYPPNLILIGTVNMDETTHGLSDKVLDRGFVLEFWDIDLASYPRWGQTKLSAAQEAHIHQLLEGLMAALAPAHLHFGWRVVDDIIDYLAQAAAMTEIVSFDQSIDDVISSKVLPKLRGEDSPRLRQALQGCQIVLKEFNLQGAGKKLSDLLDDLKTTGSARFWR